MITIDEVRAWSQDGTFEDAFGTAVHAYDDIALLEDWGSQPDSKGSIIPLPKGTSGTVLFYTEDKPSILHIEWEVPGAVFGVVEAAKTKLHLRNEEKYPR